MCHRSNRSSSTDRAEAGGPTRRSSGLRPAALVGYLAPASSGPKPLSSERWATRMSRPRKAVLLGMMLAVISSGAEPTNTPLVTFSPLRQSYTAGHRITFTVTSRIAAAVLFSCSAETLREGRWQEVLYSVNGNPRSKSTPLLPLGGTGASQQVSWDTAATNLFTPPGTYRLKVEAFEPNHLRSLGRAVSPSFKLLPKPRPVPPN